MWGVLFEEMYPTISLPCALICFKEVHHTSRHVWMELLLGETKWMDAFQEHLYCTSITNKQLPTSSQDHSELSEKTVIWSPEEHRAEILDHEHHLLSPEYELLLLLKTCWREHSQGLQHPASGGNFGTQGLSVADLSLRLEMALPTCDFTAVSFSEVLFCRLT